jgi:hypothetical protein
VPRSRKSVAIPPSTHTSSWSDAYVCMRDNFIYTFMSAQTRTVVTVYCVGITNHEVVCSADKLNVLRRNLP